MPFPSAFIAIVILFINKVESKMGQVSESNFISQNGASICVVLLFLLTIGFVLHDRRHGYRNVNYLKAKLAGIRTRLVNLASGKAEMNQKLSTEEVLQTPKSHVEVFDSEKTYIEADISGVMQENLSSPHAEVIKSMEIEPDVPKVNMKDVFQKKESKSSKHKQKKPKSKIRSRLQSKINEQQESEKDNEEYMEENSLTEEKECSFPVGGNTPQKQKQDND